MSGPASANPPVADAEDQGCWVLRLYVAGQAPRSLAAFANLKRIAEEYLPGRYRIDVVDLLKHPQLADEDQILAVPTLVRRLPPPLRRVVGDLSDAVKTVVGLNLVPATGLTPSPRHE